MSKKYFNDLDNLVVLSPVKAILEICDPFTSIVWDGLETPITEAEVLEYSKNNPVLIEHTKTENLTRVDHIRKIVYFFQNEIEKPIEIDVGIPSMGYFPTFWMITDGNHRFFAAVVKGDEFIKATISGDLDYACEIGLMN